MSDNIHAGHRKREKEKFLRYGIDEHTPAHEVLELLLFYMVKQKDTNPLAHELIDKYKNISGVLDAPIEELVKFSGITENNVVLFKMILPIARIYLSEKQDDCKLFSTSEQVGEFLIEKYMGIMEERFSLLGFDACGKCLFFEFLSRGDISSVGVSIQTVIKRLLDTSSSCAIIAHNHPNDVAIPSNADIETTKSLVRATESIGIRLLDHIIVSGNDYISMSQSNKFFELFP